MQERSRETSLPLDTLRSIQAGHFKYAYKGIPTIKYPFDLALYSLLIWNLKPKTIIEIGSYHGGSAIWLADQLRAYSIDGHVWSYDINPVKTLQDKLVTFAYADAMDLDRSIKREELESLLRPFLVIEDSSHQRATSLAVLNFFEPIMREGEFIIVEDGIVTDLGKADKFDGGPGAAIAEFLVSNATKWQIDTYYCDFFGRNVTSNPNGYLRKYRD